MSRLVAAIRNPRKATRFALRKIRGKVLKSPFRFWIYPAWWRLHFALRRVRDRAPSSRMGRFLVAVPNQGAGIGHQMANWIAGLVLAEEYGLTYSPHPLSPPDWDRFLGLDEYSSQFDDVVRNRRLSHVRLPFVRGPDDDRGRDVMRRIIQGLYDRDGVAFHLEHDQSIFDQTSAASTLRASYRLARGATPIESVYEAGRVGVALHVRRGDVTRMRDSDVGNWRERWVDDAYIMNVLRQLAHELGPSWLDIHVFSQGERAQLPAFEEFPEARFHLDDDVFWTFHQLVQADVLVASPSSFSYIAGILSPGVKIARHPWWHHIPDGDGWIRGDSDGGYSPGSVTRALAARDRLRELGWSR